MKDEESLFGRRGLIATLVRSSADRLMLALIGLVVITGLVGWLVL